MQPRTRLRVIGLSILLSTCAPSALLAQTDTPAQWLVDRLHHGQATHRDDIVDDAFVRLQLIAPDHPDVILLQLTRALENDDQSQANALLTRVQQRLPGSATQRHAQSLSRIYTPDGQQTLQQARLFAAGGQTDKAIETYQSLFANEPPNFTLALEYWRTLSGIDYHRVSAIEQLIALDQQYPGNHELQLTLSRLLLSEERADEALQTLRRLGSDEQVSDKAAEMEYSHLITLPVSQQSAAMLAGFVKRYPALSSSESALKNLKAQQAMLADPAWRAGQRGYALLEQEHYAQALAQLRQASQRYPTDGNLNGAMGQALIQLGRYHEAEQQFALAMPKIAATLSRQAAPSDIPIIEAQASGWLAKWEDLRLYNRSLLKLEQGDAYVSQGDFKAAQRAYLAAQRLKPDLIPSYLKLAELATLTGDEVEAQRWLQQAQRLQPLDERLIYAQTDAYRKQSPARALQYLEQLPPRVLAAVEELHIRVRLEQLNQQIDTALSQGDTLTATGLLLQARQLAPDAPWTTYRLAILLAEQGRTADAERYFAQLLRNLPNNAEAYHAYGLFLAGLERDAEVITLLEQLPSTQWDEPIHALHARVSQRLLRAEASALLASGQTEQALALLLSSPTPDNRLTVADWQQDLGRYAQAESAYQQLLDQPSVQNEAALGLAEVYLALRQLAPARQYAHQVQLSNVTTSNTRRRLANVHAALGNTARAQQLFEQLLEQPEVDALAYRDAGRLYATTNPKQALDYYALGLAEDGRLHPDAAQPRNNYQLTAASQLREDDNWLTRSLKSDAAALYQQQNTTFELFQDLGWRSDSDAKGLSDVARHTTIFRASTPYLGGQSFVQAEHISLSASKAEPNSLVGSCAKVLEPCRPSGQSASGAGLAVGWSNTRWSWDIGHSPVGFKYANWLGGVTYNSNWRQLGYSLTLSRRPMTNSIVSYAGMRDPVTGKSWGGVTSNGLTLGLSHDQGGVDGIWASFGYHQLQGTRVQNNQRLSAMSGYYYRLIDDVDTHMRTGLTLMYWHYAKGLDEFSLSHGGYYSPQQYLSLGIPLSYSWRNHNWSVQAESALSWSASKYSGKERLYPKDLDQQIIQAGFTPNPNARLYTASTSNSGVGLRLSAVAERRLSDHWTLGAGVNWAYSKDYAPSHTFAYLRYTLKPWRGSLPLPVTPLEPYADWR